MDDLTAKASNFEEYVEGLVGPLLANAFFKAYPEKLWGIKTREMLADWAPKRIRVCEEQEAFFGDQYCGVSAQGSGELFERIGEELIRKNGTIRTGCKLTGIKTKGNRICALSLNGIQEAINESDIVISTIPATMLSNMLGLTVKMEFRGVLSTYVAFEDKKRILPEPYSWFYFSGKSSFNRVTEPTTMSEKMVQKGDKRTYLTLETSFSTGQLLEGVVDIEELKSKTLKDLQRVKLFQDLEPKCSSFNLEKYVYPVQTIENKLGYSRCMEHVSKYTNLECIGTGANFAYNDMQVVFLQAKELAKDLRNETERRSNLSRVHFNRGVAEVSETTKRGEIIAEIGINHNGSVHRLMELIKQAATCSEIIKLQYFKAQDRIGTSVREVSHVEEAQDIEENILQLLDRCAITKQELQKSKELVESLGRKFMCTAFSVGDAKELIDLGVTLIKVASMDLNNIELHKYLASLEKPIEIFISTGMSSIEEIKAIVLLYRGCKHIVNLMACTSAYPTPQSSANIGSMKSLMEIPGIASVGYSDHTIGVKAMKVALVRGARYVEIHFSDSITASGPDQLLSKNAKDIQEALNDVEESFRYIGCENKNVTQLEFDTWRTQKKSVHARVEIKKGEILDASNTILASPPIGISPTYLLNKTLYAKEDICAGSPIREENLCSK